MPARTSSSRRPGARLRGLSQPGRSGGDADKLFEQGQLAGNSLQRLCVPLNRNDEWMLRILDRLDRSIRRPSAGAQACAETVDGLMMEGVDAQLSSAQRRRQLAAGKNRDRMSRNTAIHGLTVRDRVSNDIRQVLVQRPAPNDVERLGAATDPQHWKPHAKCLPGHRVLKGVEAGLGRPELLMGAGAVSSRGEIRTPRKHEPVKPGEETRDGSEPERGNDHRKRTSGLECPGVGHPQSHLGIGRLAVAAKRRELAGT